MNVLIVAEYRLTQLPDGTVWGECGYDFWRRYLSVFDSVTLACRVQKRQNKSTALARVDGPGVRVHPVPYYLGPTDYLWVRNRVRHAVMTAFVPGDAVILRIGSNLATPLAKHLKNSGFPYGVEVIGDPADVFAPGVIEHPLRAFFRWWFVRQQKQQCAAACGAAYVTEHKLQKRYPCGKYAIGVSDVEMRTEAFDADPVLSTYYSSVALSAADFAEDTAETTPTGTLKLVTVGSLAQLYKGVDIAIQATSLLRQRGVDTQLTIIGDGTYRAYLEDLAARQGISLHVRFLGALPGPSAVRAELRRADMFILATRTEGLPRALLEAMAQGLPCIASSVGGIPEVLHSDDLVEPGNSIALTDKIMQAVSDPSRLSQMARRNLERSYDFREEALRPRRIAFYEHIRATTEAWRQRSTAHAGNKTVKRVEERERL
jgi:glycosyltransferase involved in cell wall biosynthesis